MAKALFRIGTDDHVRSASDVAMVVFCVTLERTRFCARHGVFVAEMQKVSDDRCVEIDLELLAVRCLGTSSVQPRLSAECRSRSIEGRVCCSDITNTRLGISGETGHGGANLRVY